MGVFPDTARRCKKEGGKNEERKEELERVREGGREGGRERI